MTIKDFFNDCMNTRIYDVEVCLIEREIISWELVGNKFYFSVCM